MSTLTGRAKQDHCHRHNSLKGNCAMIRSNAQSIMSCASATLEAQETALLINNLSYILAEQLKERVDP